MFAVLQQCKIVTTAVLSRAMLGRRLSWAKWRALLLLLAGVALITHEEHALRAATLVAAGADGRAPPSPLAAAARLTHAPPGAAAQSDVTSGSPDPALSGGAHAALASGGIDVERGQGSLVLGVSSVLLETLLSGFATGACARASAGRGGAVARIARRVCVRPRARGRRARECARVPTSAGRADPLCGRASLL